MAAADGQQPVDAITDAAVGAAVGATVGAAVVIVRGTRGSGCRGAIGVAAVVVIGIVIAGLLWRKCTDVQIERLMKGSK